MSKNTIIIDFAGSSCAGKTFVKDHVFKNISLQNSCYDLSDHSIKAKDCLDFFLSDPRAFFYLLAFVICSIPISYRAMLRSINKIFTVQIKMREARSLDYDFILLDEGFFKAFSVLRKGSVKKAAFDNIPKRVGPFLLFPDVTVCVEADYDLIQERRQLRGLPLRKDTCSVLRKLNNTQLNLKKDLLAAGEQGKIKVVFYANNGSFNKSLISRIHDSFYK